MVLRDIIFRSRICRQALRPLILKGDRVSVLLYVALALAMLTTPLKVGANKSANLDSTFQLRRLSAQYRVSFESINMPDDQEPMGLFGVKYLADVKPWFYVGVVGYGALSGNQGGLFSLASKVVCIITCFLG